MPSELLEWWLMGCIIFWYIILCNETPGNEVDITDDVSHLSDGWEKNNIVNFLNNWD